MSASSFLVLLQAAVLVPQSYRAGKSQVVYAFEREFRNFGHIVECLTLPNGLVPQKSRIGSLGALRRPLFLRQFKPQPFLLAQQVDQIVFRRFRLDLTFQF